MLINDQDDIGLPVMNGFELAQAIRRTPELAGVVLVALSGYGNHSDVTAALEAGFEEHVTKPAEFATLEQILVLRQALAGTVIAALEAMGTLGSILHHGVTTDVLELLTSQHEEVDQLLENLEKGVGNRREQFLVLANKLAAHATVEEKLFYPAIMTDDTSELLHESVEEHLAIKRVLADLIEMRLDNETFHAKLSVLKEQIAHHAHEEEEKELFPQVKRMMSNDERAALGNEVLSMFEDLMKGNPSQNVPDETLEAAPLPSR